MRQADCPMPGGWFHSTRGLSPTTKIKYNYYHQAHVNAFSHSASMCLFDRIVIQVCALYDVQQSRTRAHLARWSERSDSQHSLGASYKYRHIRMATKAGRIKAALPRYFIVWACSIHQCEHIPLVDVAMLHTVDFSPADWRENYLLLRFDVLRRVSGT